MSIRSISRTVIACAGLIGAAGATASAQGSGTPKLAFIRSQDIFAQTPGRAEAETRFNKELDSARAQEKVWGDSVNTLLGDYARTESTLSADAKTTRQAAIREKQAQFQQRQQQLEQQVQQDNQKLVQPILQRINSIIEGIRAEQGYAFVFDAQATGGGVIAADKSLDITDQVIARLRAAPPPTTAGRTKPAPSTGPTNTPSGVSRPKNP